MSTKRTTGTPCGWGASGQEAPSTVQDSQTAPSGDSCSIRSEWHKHRSGRAKEHAPDQVVTEGSLTVSIE